MAIFSGLKLGKFDCLKFLYNGAHIFGLVSAIAILVILIPQNGLEEETVGEFKLDITSQIYVMFYVSSGILLLTVAIGYVAQRWPDKSSFWILYCTLLSIVSIVMLAASSSSYAKAKSLELGADEMRKSMEEQDNNLTTDKEKPPTKWDRLQVNYTCCGITSYRDWQDVGYGRTSLRVPNSCCLPKTKNNTLCGLVLPEVPDADKKIYTRGCQEPALRKVRIMLTVLYYFGFFVAATHCILTIVSCYFVVSKKV